MAITFLSFIKFLCSFYIIFFIQPMLKPFLNVEDVKLRNKKSKLKKLF